MTVKDLQDLYNSLKITITELSNRITILENVISSLEKRTETQFSNHLGQHRWDKITRFCYFALTVLMFCFLKWGK